MMKHHEHNDEECSQPLLYAFYIQINHGRTRNEYTQPYLEVSHRIPLEH